MSHGASRGNRQLSCNALFLVFETGTEARSIADGVFDLQSIYAVSIVFQRSNVKAIGTHRCPSGKERVDIEPAAISDAKMSRRMSCETAGYLDCAAIVWTMECPRYS